jgi:TRAP-type C4-dicarboxylate transport system substrate-binding protein
MLLVAGLAACLPAAAQTKWDMATAYADTEFQTRNVRDFAADIAKRSNNALAITVHSAGSLIKNPEIKRSVQSGLVPIAEFFMSNLGPEDPMFEIDAIPFVATTYDQAKKLWDASRAPITGRFAKQGLRLLYSVPWPSQAFYTKDPVKAVADLRGKKMRTYNAQTARLATLMGAVPTTVQAVEIPQAFSAGVIDTMFTSGQTGVSTRAWEYTKFYYDTGGWLPKNVVVANERAFSTLPAAVQKAITDAAAEAETRGWKLSEEQNANAPKTLGQNGLKLEQMSPAFAQELRKIGRTMLDEWLAKSKDDGKKVIDAYRKAAGN